ncbi:MAG: twin-arginine translocase subunit TatC [Aigarchaeota archaeon]|nr:twin-arginine translocase subunit TatC [Aigarchaeota archaeon]
MEEERSALTQMDDGAGSEKEMTFWEHTAELANRMKMVLYTVVVVTIMMMVLPTNLSFVTNPLEFYEPLVGAVLRIIRTQVLPPGVQLIGVELTAPLELYVIASVVFGLMFSAPVVVYEIYRFVNPALYQRERGMAYPFILSTAILVIVGAFFGYLVVTPFAVRGMLFFFPVAGAEPIISVMDFYMVVLVTVLMTAAAFTLPIFIVVLVRLGLMGTGFLRRNRRYVYPALFIATMVITPDGGPMGNVVLFFPIVALMEVGIYFAHRYEKTEETEEMPLAPTYRCKHCDREFNQDFTFCPSCGRSRE